VLVFPEAPELLPAVPATALAEAADTPVENGAGGR
jgi:hypothetical protein